MHAIHFFAFWLGYLFALAGALTLLLATLRALPVAGARGASVGETGLTLLLTAGLGLWLYGSQRRFFERAPLGAALAATCSLGVFWWLFYDWYQTLSVLGTFMVWGP